MRRLLLAMLGLVLFLAALCACFWLVSIGMPGHSFHGTPPAFTARQTALREALGQDVDVLAGRIGERSDVLPDHLNAAAAYIEESFIRSGLKPVRQSFLADGTNCSNIEAEIRGSSRPLEIVVIGAHYDSVDGAPGADDNASGVAALLALSRLFARRQPARTLRFVAFVNEEPPHFQTDHMGSAVYAERCAARREKIVAMLSIESVGYFTDAAGSQAYPPMLSAFYPSKGDFIAFAGNLGSRALVRRSVRAFRTAATVPSEGAVLPEMIPQIGWSDQWSFWLFGYEGIMVTDTAPFRNPNYHAAGDLPATLDYDRLTRVVDGLVAVVESLTAK